MPYDRWFLRYLFFALLCLTVWIPPSDANILKDVRVGEYENFTRIVFELDGDANATLNVVADTNEVRIQFPDTRPDLVRKIPVERADLIKEIQIWKQTDQLSVVIKMAALQTRVESFTLKNPSRFAVDIFWQTPGKQNQKGTAGPPPPSDDRIDRPASAGEAPAPALPLPQGQAPAAEISERTITPTVATTAKEISTLSRNEPPAALVPRIEAAPPHPSNDQAGGGKAKQRNWLQYYLVVALIVLTITILVLLVLMLLTHYRWEDSRGLKSSNEILRKQNSRIAELDERIKEQLKRYDEA